MIGAQPSVRTLCGFGAVGDQADVTPRISYSLGFPSSRLSIELGLGRKNGRRSKLILISCQSSRGRFGRKSNDGGGDDDRDHEYLEAFLLISETIRHYGMFKRGFQEDMTRQTLSHLSPFSVQAKESRFDASSIGVAFLSRFHNPTIFLKISCDGDFLLPIIVGEDAVERLIESSRQDEIVDSPNNFQLVQNLVGKLGYEVKMVRITKRVLNTYFAKIFFCKPGEKDILSVDARPSDAINVANRCKVPIYVNKQIVLNDAIKITYGMGRIRDAKSTYDVSLDSAADGPNLLGEELDMVQNMKLAVEEERYNDAAMLRDKLLKLRESRHD